MRRIHAMLLTLAALLVLDAAAGDYVMVVNKDNGVASVSRSDLKRLYTGKKKTVGEFKAVPINLPLNTKLAGQFLKENVGMSPQEYKEYWIEQQIKGLASAPMIQKADASVIAMVSQLPGAIGYVSADADVSAVKKVAVE